VITIFRTTAAVTLAATLALVVATPAGAIIDGRAAKASAYPWFASFGCGATLIAPDRVLTAAHCVTGVTLRRDLKAIVFADGTERRAVRATVPPGWVSSVEADDQGLEGASYDVAVVQLDRPVTDIRPVSLVASGKTLRSGRSVRVIGVGQSSLGGSTGRNGRAATLDGLRQATLELRSDRSCGAFYRRAGKDFREAFVARWMLCAGDPSPRGLQAATCQGDSGGPALVRDGARWRQVGITSWGKSCGADRDPPVFVDAGAARRFIDGPHAWGPVAGDGVTEIAGDARVGATVECRPPAWLEAPERVLYEWSSYRYRRGDRPRRRDGRSTYVIRQNDLGRTIRCRPVGLSRAGVDRAPVGLTRPVGPAG